ncbi:MAG: hypothetical protein IJ120_10495 [Solobacterium sp.]|nr:hypothetical protein [Solobacterium sp.]
MNGINGLNASDMTAEKQSYYMEVMLRISQKLQEVTNDWVYMLKEKGPTKDLSGLGVHF